MFKVVSPASSSRQGSASFDPTAHHVHLSGHSSSSARHDGADPEDDDDDDGLDYSSSSRLATPGQVLGSLSTYMRGHGTHLVTPASSSSSSTAASAPAQIASSLTGRVVLTNRLLSISPFYTRYTPETGDLVLGRVLSVLPGARRWKISLGSTSLSNLALSAINLPGGIQRRKLASDELQMRTFFKEGDLLVAEVQGVYQDGSTSLHTRSLRYGKLRNGRMVCVPCRLVRRGKSHFVRLRQGAQEVDMVLGLNGWIWLSAVGAMQGSNASGSGSTSAEQAQQEQEGLGGRGTGRDVDAGGTYSDDLKLPPHSTLSTLSLLSSLLQLLAAAYLPISDASVQRAWDIAEETKAELGDEQSESSASAKKGESSARKHGGDSDAEDFWEITLLRLREELGPRGGHGHGHGAGTGSGVGMDVDMD